MQNLSNKLIDELLFSDDGEIVHKSDFAILLGTAPEYAKFRAEIAASFYKKGGTRKIIASGAAVSDKTVTESSYLRSELIKYGVPKEVIIEEPHAFDTIQNITCSLTEICKRTDVMQVQSITIITEPFHLKRATELAKILLPKFIKIYGYTQGTVRQREDWKTDERLNKCVKNEVFILKRLVETGRIQDFDI